jgi:hypothetical protein
MKARLQGEIGQASDVSLVDLQLAFSLASGQRQGEIGKSILRWCEVRSHALGTDEGS